MRVQKRNGDFEDVSFDKVLKRIQKLSYGLNVSVHEVAQKVCSRIYDGVRTCELDELAAYICSSMMLEHPDFGTLASRIIISNHHKNTSPSFSETIQILFDKGLVSNELYDIVQKNKEKLNVVIDYSHDYTFDYFGFKTLEKAYLMKVGDKVVERPQHMFMRVSIGIHGNDIKDIVQTYDMMSNKLFIHATPTLFNAGTPLPQNSSCFVKGTLVYTHNRGPIPIEQVMIGDIVITHENRLRKVEQVHVNPLGRRKLMSFKCHKTPACIATEDHKFMVLPKQGMLSNWKELKSIQINDYVQIPEIKVDINTFNKSISLYDGVDIMINGDFGTLVGLWYVFGCAYAQDPQVLFKFEYCNSDKEKAWIEFLGNYGQTVFGYPMTTLYNSDNNTCICTFKCQNDEWNTYFNKVNLKININMYHWSDEFVRALSIVIDHPMEKTYCNGTILNQLFYLIRSRGIIEAIDENLIMGQTYGHIKVVDGKTFVRVVEKQMHENITDDNNVYTLGIEDDHSYYVNGMIAQNCYLVAMADDSIEGIYDTLKQCALISKFAGGIGVHIHNIRARNSVIRGTNGISTGIIPMLRVFNNTARYVNQCFAPDTKILTSDGVRAIKLISVGDLVITKGGYKPVLSIFENEVSKKVLEIHAPHLIEPITVTPEHEIYIYDTKTQIIGYKYAGDIDVRTDLVGFPRFNYMFKNNNDIDFKFLRFYGLMIMRGKIFVNNSDCCVFCERADTLEYVREYLKSVGIKYWVYENKTRGGNIVRWIKDVSKLNMTKSHLTNINVILFNLGYISQRVFIEGFLMDADKSKNSYCIDNLDINIKQNIILLLIQHNYKCKCIGSKLFIDCLLLIALQSNDMVWIPLLDICTKFYTGTVYDLNIADNHNYTTVMGLVHNSGRRNGSIAIYLEPWHADIVAFMDLKKNHGLEEDRARDLFYAMWIPDLFMERVKDDAMWSLMCPDSCRGLSDVYGQEFVDLYTKYENEGKYVKQMRAQELWFSILESQIETGTPYILYKDSINKKSNQSNIGIIKSSNLCAEIVEVSNKDETAVCNLASVCLPSYIDSTKCFDFEKLLNTMRVITKNLNKIIDRNFYPTAEGKNSNLLHRPIGIGIQGLADLFILMGYPFESAEAKQLNIDIAETMYYGAMEASMQLAKKHGKTYSSFKGSPASQGQLQFDLWGITPSDRYDWNMLKDNIKEYGLFNSLTIALMPTASTSQIMGFNEAAEPLTSNIYKRKTMAGEFILINKYLIQHLSDLGLWNSEMKNKIILAEGSIQNIPEIPDELKQLYKIVWEIKQRILIEYAADRSPFVDQSQSMNLFIESPDFKKLSSMHFFSWSKGLKTGMYYLRTKAKAKAQNFTIDPNVARYTNMKNEVCESCSA